MSYLLEFLSEPNGPKWVVLAHFLGMGSESRAPIATFGAGLLAVAAGLWTARSSHRAQAATRVLEACSAVTSAGHELRVKLRDLESYRGKRERREDARNALANLQATGDALAAVTLEQPEWRRWKADGSGTTSWRWWPRGNVAAVEAVAPPVVGWRKNLESDQEPGPLTIGKVLRPSAFKEFGDATTPEAVAKLLEKQEGVAQRFASRRGEKGVPVERYEAVISGRGNEEPALSNAAWIEAELVQVHIRLQVGTVVDKDGVTRIDRSFRKRTDAHGVRRRNGLARLFDGPHQRDRRERRESTNARRGFMMPDASDPPEATCAGPGGAKALEQAEKLAKWGSEEQPSPLSDAEAAAFVLGPERVSTSAPSRGYQMIDRAERLRRGGELRRQVTRALNASELLRLGRSSAARHRLQQDYGHSVADYAFDLYDCGRLWHLSILGSTMREAVDHPWPWEDKGGWGLWTIAPRKRGYRLKPDLKAEERRRQDAKSAFGNYLDALGRRAEYAVRAEGQRAVWKLPTFFAVAAFGLLLFAVTIPTSDVAKAAAKAQDQEARGAVAVAANRYEACLKRKQPRVDCGETARDGLEAVVRPVQDGTLGVTIEGDSPTGATFTKRVSKAPGRLPLRTAPGGP